MKCIILLAVLVGLASAVPYFRNDKIVGGNVVDKGEHPYQIHLRRTVSYFGFFESSSWGCGGSIISANWILTAAHCIKGNDGKNMAPGKLLVRVGQHDNSILENHAANHRVLRVISHPAYNPNTMANDIALLEVETIAFTEHVAAIPLAAVAPAVGTALTVSGWGTTSSGGGASVILQNVDVHVVGRTQCNSQGSYAGAILDGMLCASADGADSCQGDSGGPLVLQGENGADTLAGVVSWGRGCAFAGYPGIYADVAYYNSWIQSQIA